MATKLTQKELLRIPAKLRLFFVLPKMLFVIPVMVPFFADKGVGFGEFMLTQAIFRIAVLMFEMPSGYFSDKWCRRDTLMVGTVIYASGIVLMWLGHGFWQMSLAEVLFGVGYSFFSGTISAYTYDALELANREDLAEKEEGNRNFYSHVAEGVAMFFGGFMYAVHPLLPIITQVVLAVFSIPVLLSIPKLPAVHYEKTTNHLQELVDVIKYSLHGHSEIKWLVYYPAITSAATLVIFWSIQLLYDLHSIDDAWRGVVLAGYFAVNALLSKYAHQIAAVLGYRRMAALCLPLAVSGFLMMAYIDSVIVFALLAFASIANSAGRVVFVTLINRRTERKIRATVLSVASFVQMLVGTAFLVITTYTEEYLGVHGMWITFAIITTVIGVVPLLYLKRSGALEPAK